jgi:hypothetical protein
LVVAACTSPGSETLERIRATSSSALDASLPVEPFGDWVADTMAPTTPRWVEVRCGGALCVEARAERANGLHFGVVVAVGSGPRRARITDLYLEQAGVRRRFDTPGAWAIAVASLAPGR